MSGNSNHAQEIIIIKRNSHGEDGHHGGAWKIAFADFMTAMMALFLVLWLINAANEETKKAVASYFNPVKLVERNESKKGLQDKNGGPTTNEETGGLPSDESTLEKSETRRDKEKEFFDDPFIALAEISERKTDRANAIARGAGGGSGEESPSSPFPDPFGPDFAGQAEALGDLTQPGPNKVAVADSMTPGEEDMHDEKTAAARASGEDRGAVDKTAVKADRNLAKTAKDGLTESGDKSMTDAETAENTAKKVDKDSSAKAKAKQIGETSKKLYAEITKTMGAEKELPAAMNKMLEVKAVEDGVLISVTDQLGFSMFEIGSAVPLRQTVLAMDGIAKVLAVKKGQLRIYGHTDARPFSTPDDDNWRLSAARAHAAYFMLVRGGVKESRFSQIAGYADRQPKNPDDPNADVNRRIEILLEVQ